MVRNTKRAIEPPESVRKDVARYTVPHIALMVGCGEFDPADATTYYFGSHYGRVPSVATSAPSRLYVPISGEIKSAYLFLRSYGTTSSTGDISAYVLLNSTTATLIKTVNNTDAGKVFDNTSLSIAVTAGDYIEIKLVTPTWTTNPTQVCIGGNIYVVGK